MQNAGQPLMHLVRIRVQPDNGSLGTDPDDDQAAVTVRERANRPADARQVIS